MSNRFSVTPVILSGGSGSRLWPLSRLDFPKQFLSLYGENSLLQHTIIRTKEFSNLNALIHSPIIVANEEHDSLLAEHCKDICDCKFILEPEGKNTAASLTAAALEVSKVDPESILVVMPSDHIIKNNTKFINSIEAAINKVIIFNGICLLGVRPTSANINYGYIKYEDELNKDFKVTGFIEKPEPESAECFLKDGNYFWNSGVFIVKASEWLNAINLCRPLIFENTKKSLELALLKDNFIRLDRKYFKEILSESIDYAVIQNAFSKNISISIVELDADWNDLGTWDSIFNVSERNQDNNLTIGDVHSIDGRDNFIFSNSRLVAAAGVSNLIVIETSDVVLVLEKSKTKLLKELIDHIPKEQFAKLNESKFVNRPWGWYKVIDEGPNFKVKRIQLKPHSSLSLQKHKYRSEHWVVIKGFATITCDGKTFNLKENESSYINQGQIHRLSNQTNNFLEIIEVQSGSYLGENDIERFDDDYGRVI